MLGGLCQAEHFATLGSGMAVTDIRDTSTSRRPVEAVRVALTAGWDASLTYDLLDHEARNGEQVFVGRQEHLGPLVNAVGQPDRRGTYLVSGYRGVGKTSLIIQAIRLANPQLKDKGWTLLPLVLNVSEVSASMEPASEAEARPLRIDARRLLTALLRALRNQVAPRDSPDKLAKKIRWAYDKAEATSYLQTQQQRGEAVRSATRETRAGIQVPDVLKLVAAASLLAAATVEGVALLGSFVSYMHLAAAALAGVAVLSFSRSVTLTKSTTEAESVSEELVRDNSLHQLESELKDILQDLYEKKQRRTVIILEELDKIDDQQGQQLDSVIRYFKNLFTQAPALFFFVTDKEYYDVIAEKIQDARRRRSYAVEHTFFTHRLFVRRPAIEECLEYLKAIMASEADRTKVDAIAQAQLSRVRPGESMSPLEQVLRVLLFRSQDHFFDLKNELRQYVRVTPDGSWLECDETSMPRSDRAVAAFQFLVEQKARSNYFGGARDYANEALKSYLFAVFEGLGSTEEQGVTGFYPRLDDPHLDREGDQPSRSERDRVIKASDQLSRSERGRIVEAVDSLVEELERGGAIQMVPLTLSAEPDSEARFVWKNDAAERFQPVAKLEEWEQTLRQHLTRMAEVARLFGPGGRLAGVAVDPAQADAVSSQLLGRVKELQSSPAPLPREEAASDRREAERELAPLLERAYRAHQQRLTETYGVELAPLSEATQSPAFILSTSDQHSRPVILRYQPVGQQGDPEVGLPQSSEELERVAVVDVMFDDALADALPPAGGTLGNRALALRVPLHENLEAVTPDGGWGERTADELRFAQLWCRYEPLEAANTQAVGAAGGPYTLVSSDQEPLTLPTLSQALASWLGSDNQVLGWSPDVGPPLAAIEQALMFEREPDTSPVVAVRRSLLLLPDPTGGEVDSKAQLTLGSADVTLSEQERGAVNRLLEAGRIVEVMQLPARPPTRGVRNDPQAAEVTQSLVSGSASRTLLELVPTYPLPAGLASVSVLHPTDPRPLGLLVQFVRLWHPDYAITLLRPAADAGDRDAIRDLAQLLADRDPEESKALERRLQEASAKPS
jgi:AAA ATPase domain